MIFRCELRCICTAAVLCAIVLGQAAGAKAQDCAAINMTAASKLDDFLEKKLIFEISNNTIQLIENWRVTYGSNDILSHSLAETKGAILGNQLAAELAEVEYLEAATSLREDCPND